MTSSNRFSRELVIDLFNKLSEKRFFIVGSFALAVLEYELLNLSSIEFHDIDILCLPSLQRYCRPIYDYFKDKYEVSLSFNFYNPQYAYAEEVIQESSLFNINRLLIDVREKQIIYDGSLFEEPMQLLGAYYSSDIKVNPDCCIYYYRKLDENYKQLKKYGIPITEEINKLLQKDIMYTTDEKYIESFYSSNDRYSVVPQSIKSHKPEEYFLLYYLVQNKFERKVLDVQSF